MKRYLPAVLAASLLLSACSSTTDEPSGEAFCEATTNWNSALVDLGTGLTELGAYFSMSENPADLPSADTLHQSASSILASADEADRYIALVVANVTDPEVAKTLTDMNSIVVEMSRWMGEAARDSKDALEFAVDLYRDIDRMAAFEESMSAISADKVEDYVIAVCGDLSPLGSAASPASLEDTSAKADVSTLGKEIATYYVDNFEPDPTITIKDGNYYLLDTNIGPVSDNVTVTDQYYEGSTDWCIEVTNDAGDLKTFTYSAQDGMQAGTCS